LPLTLVSLLEIRGSIQYDISMSLNQAGIILEVVGFLLAVVFAGILLEKGVSGIWASRIEAAFSSLAGRIDKVTFSVSLGIGHRIVVEVPEKTKLSTLKPRTFGRILLATGEASLPVVAIIIVIAGWNANLPWLLWGGTSLFMLDFVVVLVLLLIDTKKQEERLLNRAIYVLISPILALLAISLMSFFSPYFFILSAFLGLTKMMQVMITILTGKDTLKKAMLIVGTILVFTGLVLELVATL